MTDPRPDPPIRHLLLVLGDQLDPRSALFDGMDPARDVILMTEAAEEASYIAQHKKRLVLFFSAMRHFAEAQRAQGRAVRYHHLDEEDAPESLAEAMARAVTDFRPEAVRVVLPGDYRVLHGLRTRAGQLDVAFDVIEDRHFLSSPEAFARFREGRKRLVLEDYYRAERKRSGWLMSGEVEPEGGAWNFDKQNRKPFGREGPGLVPPRLEIEPDETTRAVMRMVDARFPDAPGATGGFAEAVTPEDAERLLDDFIANRLACFGDYQDALASGHRTLYHSRLSAALNLKLIDPETVCLRALEAWEAGHAPLNAVEGFIRQILGWREFVRGIYWTEMPAYARRNHFEATAAVPGFFWTGETEMACLADALGGLVETAYAHHIERLMLMGLFLQLYGADPYKAHEWHISMYLDAVDWVSLPNVLGMSQHGDGGLVGTKPYVASGAYVDRMSDHCRGCRHDPKAATGERACPFTTLYWDFLARHETGLRGNRRMAMQMKNLERKDAGEVRRIRRTAEATRAAIGGA